MVPSEDSGNAAILDQAAQKLLDAGFLVRRVPMPKEFQFEGIDGYGTARSITAFPTYTNSISFAAEGGDAGAVLIPSYPDDVVDENGRVTARGADINQYLPQTIAMFENAFPGREILTVNASKIVYNAGVIHCTTMTVAAH